jgi:hypothetical protein
MTYIYTQKKEHPQSEKNLNPCRFPGFMSDDFRLQQQSGSENIGYWRKSKCSIRLGDGSGNTVRHNGKQAGRHTDKQSARHTVRHTGGR